MVDASRSRALAKAMDSYLAGWGALGPAWGVSRTMSQIHALLMVAPEPMDTDSIMAELAISRGNAHGNLKELVSWGLVRPVSIRGRRREHFEAEKDVWKVVQALVRERKRKELQPALDTLAACLAETRGLRDARAREFRRQLQALQELGQLADRVMQRIEKGKPGLLLSWAMRLVR